MSGVDALGRLLTDAGARAAFAADRAAWLEAAAVDAAGRALLEGLDLGELEAQARVLREKRAGEVAERLPRTRVRLGAAYPERFAAYLDEAPWPRGHLRHLLDARAFLAWLRIHEPRAPHSLDAMALESELARREGRGRVQVGLTHHADLPLSALYGALRVGGRRVRVILPLPLPSAWGRRWAWGQPLSGGADPESARPRGGS